MFKVIPFPSILVIGIVTSWVPIISVALSIPETQTVPNHIRPADSLESNIFLPTLSSSDEKSFQKLNQFQGKKKRFKPRLPKEVVVNKFTTTTTTTESTSITNENVIDELVEQRAIKEEESTSPSSSLSAKRNFYRRRRKPTIKNTLGTSNEDTSSNVDTMTDNTRNGTAVDIIMEKIKRAQKFKSGRKFFHSTSGSNKNRKRFIKSRSRFRPPLTTDKTILNTSTAPILATNEKLMRITANRRKKQSQEDLLFEGDDQEKNESLERIETTTVNSKIRKTTSRRKPIPKKDWSKKTSKPQSGLGAKLKAMREQRKNKYSTFKSYKSRPDVSNTNKVETVDIEPTAFDIVTEKNPSDKNGLRYKNLDSRRTRINKYSRVVIQRPVKKPSNQDIKKNSNTIKNGNEKIGAITETSFNTSIEKALDEMTTTHAQHNMLMANEMNAPREVPKEEIKHGLRRTKQEPMKEFLTSREIVTEIDLNDNLEISTALENMLNKESASFTTPTNYIKSTTEHPNDLKIAATTKRFNDDAASDSKKRTKMILSEEMNDKDGIDELDPDSEPEVSEPEPEPPTQPKLDWSEKKKKQEIGIGHRDRKHILKGSFIGLEDSQFSASENEESLANDYDDDIGDIEDSFDEAGSREQTLSLQTLFDIDTFGAPKRNDDDLKYENITPKVKRKITTDQRSPEEILQDKIKRLRDAAISSTIEKYQKEDIGEDPMVETHLVSQEGNQQGNPFGINSLASLVNLPSSFDSINDEDNFIYLDQDVYETKKHIDPLSDQIVSRRQDTAKVDLEDIVKTENGGNDDRVTTAMDNRIVSELENILDIRVPDDSRIRRKNSANRIIRRQNSLHNHLIQSEDFRDVLPDGTSLVSVIFFKIFFLDYLLFIGITCFFC